MFRIVSSLSQAVVLDTLAQAYLIVGEHIENLGDGVMTAGVFNNWMSDEGMRVTVANANNHQVTWGVLESALEALGDYMEQYGYGSVVFDIFDGANQVGHGSILPS